MKVVLAFVVLSVTLALGSHLRTLRPDEKIVGGQDANITDIPYQLSLQSYGRHICGASIISANWALTAAHCVYRTTAAEWNFRAGSSIVNQGGSIHQAVEMLWHPQYDSWFADYDLALIRVEEPFPLGQPGVQAVELADVEPADGEVCVASGWGRLSSNGPLPDHLQSVQLPIIERKRCQELYEYDGYDVTERMICAGLIEGGRDSCQGDSGGPLVFNGYQVGVVSWGIGCAFPESPGVYSNIANQREWIKQNTAV